MKTTKLFAAVLALGMMLALSTNVQAQSSDQSQTTATANMLAILSINNSTVLGFGDIYPEVSKTVAPADGAVFSIVGEADEQVDVEFTLPSNLTHDTDGTSTLPISFGTGDAGYNNTDGSTTLDGNFDPSATSTTAEVIALSTNGDLAIYLGGTVTPGIDQATGGYTGDITLDIAYTNQ